MGTIPLLESVTDPRMAAILVTYSAAVALLINAVRNAGSTESNVIFLCLSVMVCSFLPASNLFFSVGFVIAERVLYIPSSGFCLLVAFGFAKLCRLVSAQWRWFAKGILCLLLVSHITKCFIRNADWESEYTIFMAGLRVNQNNAKLFNNVGHALEGQGKFTDALHYFKEAVRVQPDDIGAHINVGRTYSNLHLYTDAEQAYRKAKSLLPKPKAGEPYQARIAPNHLNVFLNLAHLIARNNTRLHEADMLYRQAISMRSDYTQAYINRGDILIKLKRTREAKEVYEKALQYDSTNADLYYNLGVVFLELGNTTKALNYLDKALEFNPEHEQALMSSSILIQESGNPHLRPTAVDRLLKLLHKDKSNERAYFNLGMLAMDDKNHASAEHFFKTAIKLKSDFRSALFNLGLLLSDTRRPVDAVPYLKQLLKYHPKHVKGLILLGDIYINIVKDLDSAQMCYETILNLEPSNVQALHNLCVVWVEKNDLNRAYTCLSTAHKMAPHEDYILTHLKVVEARLHKLRLSNSDQLQKKTLVNESTLTMVT